MIVRDTLNNEKGTWLWFSRYQPFRVALCQNKFSLNFIVRRKTQRVLIWSLNDVTTENLIVIVTPWLSMPYQDLMVQKVKTKKEISSKHQSFCSSQFEVPLVFVDARGDNWWFWRDVIMFLTLFLSEQHKHIFVWLLCSSSGNCVSTSNNPFGSCYWNGLTLNPSMDK